MLAICTMFDEQHVAEARLCCSSIHVHSAHTPIYALCLDEPALRAASEWPVIAVPLENLERQYPDLAAVRETRDWPSYTQTCKVFLPTFIFGVFTEQALCCVDSDMYFWSDPKAIDAALGESSFMVTSREDPIRAPQGDFNGGFFACREDENSRKFFAWWQAKCLEWCRWEPGPDGRYTEEGYLNIFTDEPDRFAGICICANPGVNLAKWNTHRHAITCADAGFVVDGKWPLVCFHYKGFEPDLDHFGLGGPPEGDLRFVYERYQDALQARS